MIRAYGRGTSNKQTLVAWRLRVHIHDDHMYHGAALIQIAEHPQFTAINSLRVGKVISRSAFRINDDIAVYFKYASEPKGPYGEYHFVFHVGHLDELQKISRGNKQTAVALICVEDREICSIPYEKFNELIQLRETSIGRAEDQYTIIVTAPKGKKMRVYVNKPGRKGIKLGEILVARGAFPGSIFFTE